LKIIKSNPHYGDPIAKSHIPKEYLVKYEITNLFRVELPNYWRMLYTLKDGDTKCEIIANGTKLYEKISKKYIFRKGFLPTLLRIRGRRKPIIIARQNMKASNNLNGSSPRGANTTF
jgi:hypothetical protein